MKLVLFQIRASFELPLFASHSFLLFLWGILDDHKTAHILYDLETDRGLGALPKFYKPIIARQ